MEGGSICKCFVLQLRIRRTLGTFNPRQERYTHKAEEYTTPTGIFATGSCSAKSKIIRASARHNFFLQGDGVQLFCSCESILCRSMYACVYFFLQFMNADGKVYRHEVLRSEQDRLGKSLINKSKQYSFWFYSTIDLYFLMSTRWLMKIQTAATEENQRNKNRLGNIQEAN